MPWPRRRTFGYDCCPLSLSRPSTRPMRGTGGQRWIEALAFVIQRLTTALTTSLTTALTTSLTTVVHCAQKDHESSR